MKLPGSLALRVGRRLPPRLKQLANQVRGIDAPLVVERPPGSAVVVLAPHPDDEVLGCGGTLQKHLAAGEAVHVVFLTSGERSASLAGGAAREAEALAAAAELGLTDRDLTFLRFPDGGVDPAQAALAVEAAVAASGADLVYAPNPVDGHRDHVATCRALATALPALPGVARVALYEVWTPVHPNVVVDVGGQLEVKLRALARYASANAVVDYVHAARGLAAYRSAHGLHGAGHAEAFTVLDREPFLELVLPG